jgi:hypothetical protein
MREQMIDNFIRLGTRTLVEELEYFYYNIISTFSFKSFFNAYRDDICENISLFMFAKGYPSLYVLISKTGPYLIGLSPERGIFNSTTKQQIVKAPSDFSDFYRNFYQKINAVPPEKKEIKMFINIHQKTTSVSSFAVFGKKNETAKLLKEENVLGIKKISVSSLFTEDKLLYLLKAYERWNEKNYRIDFNGGKVFFSLKLKKEAINTESECRAVAAMVKTVVSESYSNIFEKLSDPDAISGIPMILTTFQIKFPMLPKWLHMIDVFLVRFENSLSEVDRVLDEIIFPQMKFLK